MDSIIPFRQKNTLVEYMILSSADNRPPMLDKDLYDSWKSRMELYMQNREHGRMILESVENGPLIWPTIEENGVTKTKKYVKLSTTEKIQADCDLKATTFILQGKDCAQNFKNQSKTRQYQTQDWKSTAKAGSTGIFLKKSSQEAKNVKRIKPKPCVKLAQRGAYEWPGGSNCIFIFKINGQGQLGMKDLELGDDPIACLNKAIAFLTVVAFSRFPLTNNQLRTSLNTRNQATIQDGRVTVQQVQGRQGQSYFGTGYKSDATSSEENNTEDLDTYDFDCDDISNAKAVLMANISNYGPDVISEVPHSETYLNDMENQGKEIVDIAAQKPSANTIVPGMFKLDLVPLAPKLFQNREAHIDYL
uniref:Uncharacterized protein n=1 Tax=Tanacetum cinerariifolium TaxID=118510 RepID=A0A699H0R3_TANCI|nr:hypothetical protein [Tanacetum cinerariifolium]